MLSLLSGMQTTTRSRARKPHQTILPCTGTSITVGTAGYLATATIGTLPRIPYLGSTLLLAAMPITTAALLRIVTIIFARLLALSSAIFLSRCRYHYHQHHLNLLFRCFVDFPCAIIFLASATSFVAGTHHSSTMPLLLAMHLRIIYAMLA